MWNAIKRLILGFSMIIMLSAILIISDRRPGASRETVKARAWNLHLIELVEAPAIDESRRGFLAGLKEAGLAEGRDYRVTARNAQGDLPSLGTLLDAALTDNASMICTITTPALQRAMQKVHDRPVVFTLALDPTLVGDTGTHTSHRANVAGVYDRSPFEGMMRLVRECLPKARVIGSLYAPAEPNSVNFRDELERTARAAGYQVVTVASTSSGEVQEAATALIQRGVDVICQINDNLHDAAFPGIVAAAARVKLPVFAFSVGQARQGAALVLSNDHFDGGREAGLVAARVIRGEKPADIPYAGIQKTRLLVNLAAAKALRLNFPPDVLRRADEVIEK